MSKKELPTCPSCGFSLEYFWFSMRSIENGHYTKSQKVCHIGCNNEFCKINQNPPQSKPSAKEALSEFKKYVKLKGWEYETIYE